jgi:hypothetical protein
MYPIAVWQCLSPFFSSFTSCKRKERASSTATIHVSNPSDGHLFVRPYDIQLAVQVFRKLHEFQNHLNAVLSSGRCSCFS